MKLFVDTGSIKDIEAIAALGILDGVTTNPSLLAKEPGDFRQNLKRICEIVKGPVSGEVTATDYAGMMREGHDLAGAGNIHEHAICVRRELKALRMARQRDLRDLRAGCGVDEQQGTSAVADDHPPRLAIDANVVSITAGRDRGDA